jgi:hypothetical protein
MTPRSAAILSACALLCACATAEPNVPRGSVNIFISPAGEPFRADRDAPYPLDLWFSRADADHDGALSEAEFVADAAAFFHKLDVNGDGLIDGFEISAYEQKTAPEILPHVVGLTARDIPPLPQPRRNDADRPQQDAQDERDEPRRVGPSIGGAAFYSLTPDAEPVAAADTDFDGKVSLGEFKAAARRRFALLDLNHDGRLPRAELPKTAAERLIAKDDARRKAGGR